MSQAPPAVPRHPRAAAGDAERTRTTHPGAPPPRTARGGTAGGRDGAEAARAGRWIVPVLAFGGISVAVMQTLLVPVVAQLPALLGTAPSNAAWVITATLLSGAVATPIMGRLGDLYGKRRIILLSLGLMVLGSLVCGLTSALVPMVAGRALQGFAMGAIPLGIGVMRDVLPPEQLGSAMAFMSSSLGVGGALGMPLAAYLAQHTDWHVLFFGAAGLGVLAMVLVAAVVPESRVRTPGRFDVLGAVGLSAALVALLLPVSKGGDWGWGSGTTLGLFGAAAVLFGLWGVLELRIGDPLVDLRTTARRQVLLTNLASIMVGLAFYAATLVLPQLLQLPRSTGYGLGQSMVVSGLCVAPMGVAMMLVSSLSARLSAARGPKVSLMTGLVLLAVAYLAGTVLMAAVWQVVVTAVLIGVGIGVAYSAMPALILGAVDPSESGAANGLNTLMRSIGTSTSSAVIGVVLARMTTPLGGAQVPDLAGFRVSFLIAAGAALLGLLVAAFLPGRARAAAQPAAQLAAPGTAPGAVPGPGRGSGHGAAAPEGPAVHGVVLGADGAPVAGAVVTLLDHGGRQLGRAPVAADGAYALPAPPTANGTAPPGGRVRARTYGQVLVAAAPGHLPRATPLGPPATHGGAAPVRCDLRLRPAGAVRGAVRARGGRPLEGARVSLLDASGTVVGTHLTGPDGGYAFTGVRSGPYTLVARGQAQAEAPLEVAPGATHDHHDLYLPHGAAPPVPGRDTA